MGGIKHTYTLDGAKILREQWVEGEDIKREITPLYDNEDNVCGILYGDIPYYFLKNLQGDVIAITNQYGETVARYTYDAWGACTISYDATATPTVEGGEAINIATVNPFRYRSYYFDTETGLYYLQSRYYAPALGRFVNGDDTNYSDVSGANNLFAYCENNPVTNFDPDGHLVITSAMIVGAIIGAVVLGTVGGIGAYHLSKKWKVPKGKRWTYVLGGVVIGAIVGALIGGTVGYLIGPSANSGLVLWSGSGQVGSSSAASKGIVLWSANGQASVSKAAVSFAKANKLRVLNRTFRGRILRFMDASAKTLLGKSRAKVFMKPLWDAASEQFARTGKGVVHFFLNASGIDFESTFLTIEYWIVRDLGLEMVFHFID